MNNKKRLLLLIPVLLLAGFLLWYFSRIVIYIIIAAVLSITGRPLVKLLDKIRIGRFRFPHTLSAALTLLTIFGLIFGLIALLLPLLLNQAAIISSVDGSAIASSFGKPLEDLQQFLVSNYVLQEGESLEAIITEKFSSFLNLTNVTDILNSLLGITGNIFIAIFAIGFITFFFLKQERMLMNGIMLFTPVEYQTEVKHIYIKTIRLLSRYFLGLLLDLSIVMTLITLGMTVLGMKNALLIGFFAGMMNVVPYIGPFIGAGIAVLLGVSGSLGADFNAVILPLTLKILGILVAINLLDAFLIQPTIYANRVRAHPLEIFLVIMIAGSFAGITGMILAIPGYTVLRIVAKEFMGRNRFVEKITARI
jgi:predicted PurR-regulated permease PerM